MKRKILITITYVLVLVTLVCMCAVDTAPVMYIPIAVNMVWFYLMLIANRKELGIYAED